MVGMICLFVLMLPLASASSHSSVQSIIIPDELPWYRLNNMDYYVDTRVIVDCALAEIACKSFGGALPVLNTSETREFFLSLIPPLARKPYNFFLALKPKVDDNGLGLGPFGWYDGAHGDYDETQFDDLTTRLESNASWWAPAQPSTANSDSCVSMGAYDKFDPEFKWNVVDKDQSTDGVGMLACQRRAVNPSFVLPPTDPFSVEQQSIGLRLREYNSSDVDWVEYRDEEIHIALSAFGKPVILKVFCEDLGAQTVTPRSADKRIFLQSQIRKALGARSPLHSFLIGTERRPHPHVDSFLWTNNGADVLANETAWFFDADNREPKMSPGGVWDASVAKYKFVAMGDVDDKFYSNIDYNWTNIDGGFPNSRASIYPICQRPKNSSYFQQPPNYDSVNAGKKAAWNGYYHVYIPESDYRLLFPSTQQATTAADVSYQPGGDGPPKTTNATSQVGSTRAFQREETYLDYLPLFLVVGAVTGMASVLASIRYLYPKAGDRATPDNSPSESSAEEGGKVISERFDQAMSETCFAQLKESGISNYVEAAEYKSELAGKAEEASKDAQEDDFGSEENSSGSDEEERSRGKSIATAIFKHNPLLAGLSRSVSHVPGIDRLKSFAFGNPHKADDDGDDDWADNEDGSVKSGTSGRVTV